MALTLESSRHIPCAVACNLRSAVACNLQTAHGMCLLLCGQADGQTDSVVRRIPLFDESQR